jgi:hypothetical protein
MAARELCEPRDVLPESDFEMSGAEQGSVLALLNRARKLRMHVHVHLIPLPRPT